VFVDIRRHDGGARVQEAHRLLASSRARIEHALAGTRARQPSNALRAELLDLKVASCVARQACRVTPSYHAKSPRAGERFERDVCGQWSPWTEPQIRTWRARGYQESTRSFGANVAFEALSQPRGSTREDCFLARQPSLGIAGQLAQDSIGESRHEAAMPTQELHALAHRGVSGNAIQELELIGAQKQHQQNLWIRATEVRMPLDSPLQVAFRTQHTVTKLRRKRALHGRKWVERLRQDGRCVRLVLRDSQ
jgi:hypothetical protein